MKKRRGEIKKPKIDKIKTISSFKSVTDREPYVPRFFFSKKWREPNT